MGLEAALIAFHNELTTHVNDFTLLRFDAVPVPINREDLPFCVPLLVGRMTAVRVEPAGFSTTAFDRVRFPYVGFAGAAGFGTVNDKQTLGIQMWDDYHDALLSLGAAIGYDVNGNLRQALEIVDGGIGDFEFQGKQWYGFWLVHEWIF